MFSYLMVKRGKNFYWSLSNECDFNSELIFIVWSYNLHDNPMHYVDVTLGQLNASIERLKVRNYSQSVIDREIKCFLSSIKYHMNVDFGIKEL